MKVLIATGIFPPDIGGPATYSKTLTEELSKRGVEVKVITYGKTKHYPWFFRHAVFGLKVFWNARNNDIIFAQDPMNSAIVSWVSAVFWRKKFVMKVIGDYAWEQGVNRFGVKELLDEFLNKKYGFRVEFLRRIEKFVANHADVIIVPSNYLRGVVKTWGIDQQKIKVIYNTFYISRMVGYYNERTGTTEKGQLGLSGKRVVVSAGRLVPWKGFTALVEIAADLIKNFPDLKLVIIGDGPEKPKIIKETERLKLRNYVILTNSIPHHEVLKYLKAAEVFVLNTAYEGLSHQILEAMAMEVPIVTTDVGGNTELIKNKESGFLVEYNDKQAIKNIIISIFNDATRIYEDGVPVYLPGEKVRKITENAKKEVQKFTVQNMIDKTLEVLKEI